MFIILNINKITKIGLICFILCLMLTQTGCNYREINNMPMITGMAIDKVEESYLVTAQVIIPNSDGGGAAVTQVFINSAGETIFDAIRDFIMKEGEKVFFGHLGFFIISNEIAQNDVSELIDFLVRDDEIRPGTYLLIGDEGVKASDLLTVGLNNNELSFYIPNAFENADYVSKFNPVTLEEIVECVRNKTKHEIVPILGIESVLGSNRIIINDGAIINHEKVVGVLNGEEVKIVRLIREKGKGGIFVINFKDDNKETKVSLEVRDSISKLDVTKYKDTYLVNIYTDINVTIREIINNEVEVLDYKKLEKFTTTAEKDIEKRIKETIKKTQKEYATDVFGFGEKVKMKYPKDYKEISENWDSIYSSIDYDVNVNVTIVGSELTEQVISK